MTNSSTTLLRISTIRYDSRNRSDSWSESLMCKRSFNSPPHLVLQIVVINSFVVITKVGIRKVNCTWLSVWSHVGLHYQKWSDHKFKTHRNIRPQILSSVSITYTVQHHHFRSLSVSVLYSITVFTHLTKFSVTPSDHHFRQTRPDYNFRQTRPEYNFHRPDENIIFTDQINNFYHFISWDQIFRSNIRSWSHLSAPGNR